MLDTMLPSLVPCIRDAALATSIFTTGDVIAQRIEHNNCEEFDSCGPFSVERTVNAAGLGALWGGGISPAVYRSLERFFPGTAVQVVILKVVLSLLALSVVGNYFMIFARRMLVHDPTSNRLRQRLVETARSVNADFPTVLSFDVRVWPATDLLVCQRSSRHASFLTASNEHDTASLRCAAGLFFCSTTTTYHCCLLRIRVLADVLELYGKPRHGSWASRTGLKIGIRY